MEPRSGVKTKVALVSLTPFFGGGEVYSARLCELLREDWEIHAVVASEELARRISWVQGVEVVQGRTGLHRLKEARRRLRAMVLQQQIPVVHLNGQAEANLVPTCRRMGAPTVITRHTDLRLESGVLKRALYRRNAARANAVVCVSGTLAEQHRAFVRPERLQVIPHWVDASAETRRASNDPYTVLFVGRAEEAKGVQEFATAARLLPHCRFVVAGDGSLRQEIERLGIANLEVLGFREDVNALLASADVLVNPSHSEGSSLVVLEAMAAGVPCVVSDIPVLRELLRDGALGVIVPPGDSARLAQAIEALREQPEQGARWAEQARRAVEKENCPKRIRERYRQLFAQVLEAGAGLPQAA
jgi:glycosyltransferase involved in cell wall biosynthesis